MADRKSALDTIASSINRSGSIGCRATVVDADTMLARNVDLVQQAQN